MATAKTRTSLYLTKDIAQRAMTLFDEIPGHMSLSRFVDEWLQQVVPVMETIWEQAKTGDRDALVALVDHTFLDHIDQAMTMRTTLREKAEKGDET